MNDVVFNDLRWPIEETCQAIWDVLQDHGRIKWKQTFWDLEKALDVANQDVMYKFNMAWEVKGLVMTQSNLVVMWKVTRHMGLISWVPLGLRWLYQDDSILVPF